MGVLAKTAAVDNWIERLPAALRAAWGKCIIYRAAVHMHREEGMAVGHSIASAINWCEYIVATGDVENWEGPQRVNPASVAECAAALAIWAQMKAYARAHKGKG